MRIRLPKIAEGLLWAVIGGAAAGALELKDAFGKWKDYEVDMVHVGQEASAGAIMGGVLFLRDLARRRLTAEGLPVAANLGGPDGPPAAPGG